jgi:hypothetical protein
MVTEHVSKAEIEHVSKEYTTEELEWICRALRWELLDKEVAIPLGAYERRSHTLDVVEASLAGSELVVGEG